MVWNVHQRWLPVPAATVWKLVERVTEPDTALWPVAWWPPLRLDRPIGVGADGGHGFVRYQVVEYSPPERVVFRFAPAMRLGSDGTHAFLLTEDGDGGCVLRHELIGRPRGVMRLGWPLVIRWLHDALIEDLLDRAATAVDHPPATPARWSPWVRLLHAVLARAS